MKIRTVSSRASLVLVSLLVLMSAVAQAEGPGQVAAPAPAAPAQAPPAQGNGTGQPSPDYQIGPEDLLDISVWNNPALSRTAPVRPDGKISLPLLNDVQAAGLTPMELRERLLGRLAEYMPHPEVSVVVTEVRSFK